MGQRFSWQPPPVYHCKWIFIRTYTCLIWSTSGVCAGTTSFSKLHKWSSYLCQIQSETLCRRRCLLSYHLNIFPIRDSPERYWTLNAGVINGTWNLTPLNSKSFTQQGPKPNSYIVHSSQMHTGICIFSKISWYRHLFRPIMGYAHKSHF